MTDSNEAEFFGNDDQRAMQRNAVNLWALLRDDPRFCCYGRPVSVDWDPQNSLQLQIALARLQGASSCTVVPAEQHQAFTDGLEAAGLTTDWFENWSGAESALASARQVLARRSLPDDLELVFVNRDTPPDDLRALAQLTEDCGVLLPMGRFIRGLERPAVCLFVRDRSGRPVCSSAAVDLFHPASDNAGLAWWGMLATDADRRGQGLAQLMGAHSILAMNDRFGTTRFFTGIRADNAPSKALCTKLGLTRSDSNVIVGMDPEAFGSGRVTK